MRKLISLVLTLVMVLSFASCQVATNEPEESISYASAKVSFLGPTGTYTQEACEKFFNNEGEYLPYETVPQAVEALVNGASDYAVIPQENTIGGVVVDYVDTLIAQTSVSVVGEVELPINQNLLVLPGTKLSDIKTVYSHKQGIAQGKDWLSQNLPDAEVIEVSSTAEGARMISESKDPSCAAIASAGCADVYGLEILANNIQNNDKNKTRLYVLSLAEPSQKKADRIAFIAKGKAEDLPKLLANIKSYNVTLITIHDRPLKTELGEYYYLVECADISYDTYQKIIFNNQLEFRYLGSFKVY